MGQGRPRSFTFDDLLAGRLLRDLQQVTQVKSFKLLKQLIEDVRGTIKDPMRGWTAVSNGVRHEESWAVVTWAKIEYRVSLLKSCRWADLPEQLAERKIKPEGPFIVFALHEIERQESTWWEGLSK